MAEKTMKAAQFTGKGSNIEIFNVPIPVPKKGEVRIEVHACGICHSDVLVKYGAMGNTYPRTPGHEVAGIVDEVGEGVTNFKKGDHVGVGWFGGHCGDTVNCQGCRVDAWVCCSKGKICGIHYDGGYAEYMVAPHDAVARLPKDMDFAKAGPLLCAGITTFNSLRQSGGKPGDLCVVQGIGGLGHLAIQFANKMGFKVVAVSNGKEKEALAKKLGAHVYIDGSKDDAAKQIKELGGARIVMATAPNAKAVEALIPSMGINGKLLIIAAIMEPLSVNSLFLLSNRCSISGWASGDSRDSEDTVNFAQTTGIETMIETFPLEKAAEALEFMLANKARFRAVLKIK